MNARRLQVLLVIPALLLAQGVTPKKSIPDNIVFHFFFLRFAASESAAKAKGKSESTAKRALKDKAGLTDVEISLLKEVALSCNDAYDAKTRSGGPRKSGRSSLERVLTRIGQSKTEGKLLST